VWCPRQESNLRPSRCERVTLAWLSYSGMVPRDRIARPPRRASTCRSTDELPRHGAGGGTRTPGDPRSAAACLRCSATPARRATQVQGPGLEPGIFAFRARRGTDSTIPVRACGRYEGGGPMPPPSYRGTRARARTRRSHSAHVRVHMHGDSISVSNLDIRGVKGRGPSSTDPLIGGDSLVGQKKRAWSSTRPFDVGVGSRRYGELSPLICRAWPHVRGWT
jgi:hypothetical protein